MSKKEYNFGEKKEEFIGNAKLPVSFLTPKYKEAKAKAIELLESEKYKDVLEESDFWILVNTYANKTKVMYSGLIISHDGCLKINDSLEADLKFKSECVSLDTNGYKNSLVFTYISPEQGLYEVGEVSDENCKNDYPYAMALKRCFDRVVLKNSKIAYSGIYSDSEADEFVKRNDDISANDKKNKNNVKTKEKDDNTPHSNMEKPINYREMLIDYCKEKEIDTNEIAKEFKLNGKSKEEDFKKVLDELNERR